MLPTVRNYKLVQHTTTKNCFHNCIVAMGVSSSQFKVQYVKPFVSWNRHPSCNRRKGKFKVAVLVHRIQLYLLPETYKEQKQQIESFYPLISYSICWLQSRLRPNYRPSRATKQHYRRLGLLSVQLRLVKEHLLCC